MTPFKTPNMTPQEAAAFAASHQYQPAIVQEFLLAAPPRDIQEFTHLIQASDAHDRCLNLARVALDIRLAEDRAKAAEQLERHTGILVDVSKALLQNMEFLLEETKTLRRLTVGLLVFTVGLLLLTGILLFR